MRRSSMLVALAISACLAAPAERPIDELDAELLGRKKRSSPRQAAIRQSTAPASTINRHTGEPHKHSREIARRLRQQARKREQSA